MRIPTQSGVGIPFICLFLPDLIGRRALVLGGSCLMLAGLIVVAAIGGSKAQPTGALANLVIVSSSYLLHLTGLQLI
jgi:hypothetical protein